MNLLPKTQLMIGVNEEFVEPTITAICKAAKSGAEGTGQVGDGKIFVLPLDECIRASDDQRGQTAI